MASVDPITPSTASAVVTSAANASLSPNESTVTLPQPEPPPTSPMDTSSLVVPEVAFTLPVVQPVLNDVTIKPESPTASSAATTNSAATTTSNPLKRPRHKPGERKELLERAVRDVREQNISMRKAASRYNLAKSSLCDYVRKNHIILPNNRCKPSAAAVAAAAAAATSGANNSSAGEHQLNHHHARLDSASASQSSGALQPPPLSAGGQAGLFSFPLDTSGLLRATHTSTPPGAGSASVLSRLESPWNNVSGLPTQVPMQNWSSLATATAHGKSMGLLSQVSNASSPKQPESLLSIHADSNSPLSGSCDGLSNNGNNNNNSSSNGGNSTLQPQSQYAQLPATSVFSTTSNITPSSTPSFICAPLSSEALESMTTTTPFFAAPNPMAPPTFAVTTHFPSPAAATSAAHLFAPPSSLAAPATIAAEALIPTTLSRSLASIYAPPPHSSSTPQIPPPSVPLSIAAATHLPFVFGGAAANAGITSGIGGMPNTAETNVMVDSLQRLILAAAANAARGDGKQLLHSGNLGDLLLLGDLSPSMGFPAPLPPTQLPPVAAAAAANDLLRKLQMFNNHNSLIGGPTVTPPGPTSNAPGGVVNNSSNSVNSLSDEAVAAAYIARLPQSQMTFAKELITFINKSPTPFHVVRSATEILTASGFRELSESEPWKLGPNDCVFVTKNHTSLFAIAVGGAYKPGEGFGIIGAHTDSPCLRLKPYSERIKEGFVELAVQTYGGGLWYTWFDRELTLAGRCIVRNSTTGALEERLVHLDRPLACVPSLAIHLNREANKSFAPDPEVHLAPILCTTLTEQLNACGDVATTPGHPAALLRLLATELQCAPSDLVELELYLADTQPARIGGIHEEFIHAPRLDNQFSAYTAIRGLVNSMPSLKDESFVRIVCLYDHEEVGSRSFQGANSVYTECILRRVVESLSSNAAEAMDSGSTCGGSSDAPNNTSGGGAERCLFERTMTRSFILSADQAHAVHPSWPEKHEPSHKPAFHQGLVLKHHCSQSYATNGLTSAIVKEIARRSSVPLQEFVVRQDQQSGSTIGPIMATSLGIMTADIGGAQLAMHSCREMTCTSSVGQAVTLFTGFFEHLANILSSLVTLK